MTWYNNYLTVFEQPLSKVPQPIIEEVQKKIKEKQSDTPLVSVVLIAHNEATHLLSCLWSLSDNKSDFPMEILAINNNSTDDTSAVLDLLGVIRLDETKKGPGHARQCGLNHARGKYHLCIDADTMYPPYYIETHVKELMKSDIVCTYGLWSFMQDERHSRLGLYLYESLRDIHLRVQSIKRPELCVRGMNFGFDTDLARRFGFRTDILRGEDGSLALAMKPYGKMKFITSSKVRVLTSNGTLNADGSLLRSFGIRIIKALKGFFGLFISKRAYKDKNNNLLSNGKSGKINHEKKL